MQPTTQHEVPATDCPHHQAQEKYTTPSGEEQAAHVLSIASKRQFCSSWSGRLHRSNMKVSSRLPPTSAKGWILPMKAVTYAPKGICKAVNHFTLPPSKSAAWSQPFQGLAITLPHNFSQMHCQEKAQAASQYGQIFCDAVLLQVRS